MKRPAIVVGFALIGVLSFGLYVLEHEVQGLEQRLADVNQELLENQNTVRVLNAEWSYLNRPDRLQQLAARHGRRLSLMPMSPSQIGTVGDLPWREVAGEMVRRAAMPQPAFKPTPASRVVLISGRGAD